MLTSHQPVCTSHRKEEISEKLSRCLYRRKKSTLIYDLKEQVRGASIETLRRLAQENPLIPLDLTIEGMTENLSANGIIQSYCQQVVSQPDIPTMVDVGDISGAQRLARDNAEHWMEQLNPQVVNVFTRVKQFANFYSALSDKDIDQLTGNLNTPDGIREFRELMLAFRDETGERSSEVKKLTDDLETFGIALATDLTNFNTLKASADALLESVEVEELKQQQANALSERDRHQRDLWIAVGISAVGGLIAAGVLGAEIKYQRLLSLSLPGWVRPVAILSVITALAAAALIASAVVLSQKMNAANQRYLDLSVDISNLEARVATLQSISDSFTHLWTENVLASEALEIMVMAWKEIGSNFEDIADAVQGVLSAEEVELINTQLKLARDDVLQLKTFAEQCEREGILPVVPDEETVQSLGLPTSWSNQSMDGRVFMAFAAGAQRRLRRLGRSVGNRSTLLRRLVSAY